MVRTQHSAPEALCWPLLRVLHGCKGALRWAVLSVRFTHAGAAGCSLPALNQVCLPILLVVAST